MTLLAQRTPFRIVAPVTWLQDGDEQAGAGCYSIAAAAPLRNCGRDRPLRRLVGRRAPWAARVAYPMGFLAELRRTSTPAVVMTNDGLLQRERTACQVRRRRSHDRRA